MAKEEYTQIAWPAGDAYKAMRCACCGGKPEAWQFVTVSDQVQRVVMCETVDLERDEEEQCLVDGGCPYSMPPARFYCGTLRDAVKMWNHMNGKLVAKRAENAALPVVPCEHRWKVTQQGALWHDCRCDLCGETKRETWD